VELFGTLTSEYFHGCFSTYAANSFGGFVLWAGGAGNEYADMPQWAKLIILSEISYSESSRDNPIHSCNSFTVVKELLM
jgi:hypothetical protein